MPRESATTNCSSVEIHTCHTCGWQWSHGTNGSHRCETLLLQRIRELEEEKENKDRSAFASDTFHRIMVEAARYWVIEHKLRTGELPTREVRFAYANGPHGFDWGNAPGPDDPDLQPLRYKRVRVTFEVEDNR